MANHATARPIIEGVMQLGYVTLSLLNLVSHRYKSQNKYLPSSNDSRLAMGTPDSLIFQSFLSVASNPRRLTTTNNYYPYEAGQRQQFEAVLKA